MIPGYRNFDLLVRGGSADIYRAWQDSVRRYVAVKVVRNDRAGERDLRDFAREKAVHTDLAQRGLAVVQVIDARRTDDGRPCLVMQLYDGSVQQWLDEASTTLTVEQAVQVLVPIATVLQAAHDSRVVHGDVKPENVLLSEAGSALADFGSANGAAAPALEPGQRTRLTPRHAAPEVLAGGAPTPQSDVWSLGSTLYRLLAPRAPFEQAPGEPAAAFVDRVRYDPVPGMLRPLNAPVSDLLAAMLAKEPAARPAAGEVRDRLLDLGGDLPAPPPLAFASPATRVAPPPDAPGPDDVPAGAPTDPSETIDWQHGEEPPEGPTRSDERRRPWLGKAAVAVLLTIVVAGVALRLLGPGDGTGGQAGPTITIPESVPPAEAAPDLAPSDLVVDDFGDTVDVRWTDNSGGRLTFTVIYRTPGEDQQIVEVDPGVTAVTVHGLDPDLGYCFRVLGIGVDQADQLVRAYADAGVRGCEPQP